MIYTIKMLTMILLLVLAILAIYIYSKESMCSCDGAINLGKNGVINPFIWPYSASDDVNKLNAQAYAASLQSPNTPDHVPPEGAN